MNTLYIGTTERWGTVTQNLEKNNFERHEKKRMMRNQNFDCDVRKVAGTDGLPWNVAVTR